MLLLLTDGTSSGFGARRASTASGVERVSRTSELVEQSCHVPGSDF